MSPHDLAAELFTTVLEAGPLSGSLYGFPGHDDLLPDFGAVAEHRQAGNWRHRADDRRDHWRVSSFPSPASYVPKLPETAGTVAPGVTGACPCCWAMIAASTTCRSVGSIVSGPPGTGTCQTCIISGVMSGV